MAYTAIGDIWTVKKKNLLSYLILWIDTNFPRRARSVNSMGGTLQPRRGTRTCFSACYITVKGKKRGPSRGIQVASSDTEGMKKKVNIKRMRPQGGWKKASYNAGVATVKYNAIGAPMTIKLLPLNRHSCVAKAYRNTHALWPSIKCHQCATHGAFPSAHVAFSRINLILTLNALSSYNIVV